MIMKEVNDFEFSLDNISLSDLIENKDQVFIQFLNSPEFIQFKDYLFDSLINKDGGPTFSDFKILKNEFNQDTLNGKFRLQFNIDRMYCCSDDEFCNTDYVDFSYCFLNGKLIANTQYFIWQLNN